jgi:hypothetical protein
MANRVGRGYRCQGRRDPDHFPQVLDAVQGDIDILGADGIYDSVDNHRSIAERGALTIIAARIGAAIRPESAATARNAVMAVIEHLWDDKTGDAGWKVASGYHARSRIESERFRYKWVLGESMRTKTMAAQTVEVLLGCRILNRFLELRRGQTFPVASSASPVT